MMQLFSGGRGRASKAGSSAARAARARKGHARRRGRLFESAHYKGSPGHRTKRSWLG